MSRVLFRDMDARGTKLFSPQELDRLVQTVVTPEIGPGHSMAVVAATSTTGVQAALMFRKSLATGEFRCEAAWQHEWSGDTTVGAKVVWSM